MFVPLKDMIRDRHLIKKHFTLKIDTEGGEYSAFKYLPTEYLDYIDQIVIEFHFGNIFPETWGHLDIYRSIADKFIPVNYHPNNFACYPPYTTSYRGLKSKAYEMILVNKKLIKLKSNSRSFALHPINSPNDPKRKDCPP
jgi:hypothetical protein